MSDSRRLSVALLIFFLVVPSIGLATKRAHDVDCETQSAAKKPRIEAPQEPLPQELKLSCKMDRFKPLADSLKATKTLRSLALELEIDSDKRDEVEKWVETLSILTSALGENTSLKTVKLRMPYNDTDAWMPSWQNMWQAVSQVLKNQGVSSLKVLNMPLHTEDFLQFSNALATHPSIMTFKLGVDSENLGMRALIPESSRGIADGLQRNTVLRVLELFAVFWKDEDVKVLAQALRQNTTLKALALDGGMINADGVTELLEALKVNTSLVYFSLYRSTVDGLCAQAFTDMLRVNKTLRVLDLGEVQIWDANNEQVPWSEDQVETVKRAAEASHSLEVVHFPDWEGKKIPLSVLKQADLGDI